MTLPAILHMFKATVDSRQVRRHALQILDALLEHKRIKLCYMLVGYISLIMFLFRLLSLKELLVVELRWQLKHAILKGLDKLSL